MTIENITRSLAANKTLFWAKVALTADSSRCWNWKAGTFKRGYGAVRWQTKTQYAHRVAFEIFFGRKPKGVLRHRCDQPSCVNPRHLLEGTQRQNMEDKVQRGRQPRGSELVMAKLTEPDVLFIRSEGSATMSRTALAERYRLSPKTIGKIIRRGSWKHI